MLKKEEINSFIDYENLLKKMKSYESTKKKIKEIISNPYKYNISEEDLKKYKDLYRKCITNITTENLNEFVKYLFILNNVIKEKNTISNGKFEDYLINFKIKTNKSNEVYWHFYQNGEEKAVIVVKKENSIVYVDHNIKLYINKFEGEIFINTPNEFGTFNNPKIFTNKKTKNKIIKILKNLKKPQEKAINLISPYKLELNEINTIFNIINNENYNEIKRLMEKKKDNLKELVDNLKLFSKFTENIFNMSKEENEQIQLVADINPKEYLKNNAFEYIINKTKDKILFLKK